MGNILSQFGIVRFSDVARYVYLTISLFAVFPTGIGSNPTWYVSKIANKFRNEYFRAGVGLLAVSAATGVIRAFATVMWRRVRSSCTVTVEIPSRDHAHAWILELMNELPYSKKTRTLALETTYERDEDGVSEPKVLFVPNIGHHFFSYKNKWIWLTRDRDNSVSDFSTGGPLETMTLTTFGTDRQALQTFISDAMKLSMEKEEGKTVIYTVANGDWTRFGVPRAVRPLHSVVLEKNISEKILTDSVEFLNSSKWYHTRGIPYKRGYLFYGPPGSGKTSFITALAGELKLSICIINLNNQDLNDEQLSHLLNNTPNKRCLILIEDVDAAAIAKGTTADHFGKGVTLSGLLNVLDGVVSPSEGRLIFMTTNHFQLLDAALIRPGRVDMKVHFGLATQNQARRLFLNFYPGEEKLAKEFEKRIPDRTYSMAQLQAYFVYCKSSPAQVVLENVENLGQIVSDPNSEILKREVITIDSDKEDSNQVVGFIKNEKHDDDENNDKQLKSSRT